MAYEDKRRSRVVVQTPTSRREVSQTEPVVVPDRNGVSATTVGIIVVIAVAVITVLVLLLLSGQTMDNSNSNLAQQSAPVPQTTIVQQPAQQPPVIVQQPAPATQPAPIIVTPPTAVGGSTQSGTDDAAIQSEIDKRIADDPSYSTLGITATVLNGKVTLVGVVKSETMKLQLEKMIKAIKGVKSIDNQITVNAGE